MSLLNPCWENTQHASLHPENTDIWNLDTIWSSQYTLKTLASQYMMKNTLVTIRTEKRLAQSYYNFPARLNASWSTSRPSRFKNKPSITILQSILNKTSMSFCTKTSTYHHLVENPTCPNACWKKLEASGLAQCIPKKNGASSPWWK